VKAALVVLADVRDGTTNACVWRWKVLLESPGTKTVKDSNASGFEIFTEKGKNEVLPKTLLPVEASEIKLIGCEWKEKAREIELGAVEVAGVRI
jgi:hypothetical protein